jgi:hypothetical protein
MSGFKIRHKKLEWYFVKPYYPSPNEYWFRSIAIGYYWNEVQSKSGDDRK